MDVSLESKSLPTVGNSRKSYLQVTSQKLARGGLQGEFGDLDIKYLKQNISRCRSEISGSFKRNSVALCKNGCPGNLNCRLRMLSGGRNFGYEISGEGGMSAGLNSSPGGMSYAARRYPEQLHPDSPRGHAARSLSGFPQGEAHNTREHHTPDNSISYPDMLSGSLTNVSKPCYSPYSPPSDGVSGRPVRTSFAWIPKNSPQSWIALVIKKLSKHQNITQID
uniref:Uncharacterized protein n=1 Tax=Vitis vinifera TaxID=29760 RepID=A5AGJ6_VITVI|nr:hypothetical protein VITISV_014447 [Vitis vinifera]